MEASLRTAGPNGRSAFHRALENAGAPLHEIDPLTLSPMLAESAGAVPPGSDWIAELKIDGYRGLLAKGGASPEDGQVLYRSGREVGAAFPELLAALRALPLSQVILDGEIARLDARGKPSFALLQQRAASEDERERRAMSRREPVVYFAFDLLAAEGRDLRGLPLLERKGLLKLLLEAPRAEAPEGVASAQLAFVEHVEGKEAARLFERARAVGLEGIVLKRASSPYRAGRSSAWKKLRVERTADLAICGFQRGRGSREALGSLHLAAWDGARFVYAGSVGSGLRQGEIEPLAKQMRAGALSAPPCAGAPRSTARDLWCTPRLVCEVRYFEVTTDGLLRQPVFLRLRGDKTPRECPPLAAPAVVPAAARSSVAASAHASSPASTAASRRARWWRRRAGSR